jgi:hypothetical protein
MSGRGHRVVGAPSQPRDFCADSEASASASALGVAPKSHRPLPPSSPLSAGTAYPLLLVVASYRVCYSLQATSCTNQTRDTTAAAHRHILSSKISTQPLFLEPVAPAGSDLRNHSTIHRRLFSFSMIQRCFSPFVP